MMKVHTRDKAYIDSDVEMADDGRDGESLLETLDIGSDTQEGEVEVMDVGGKEVGRKQPGQSHAVSVCLSSHDNITDRYWI